MIRLIRSYLNAGIMDGRVVVDRYASGQLILTDRMSAILMRGEFGSDDLGLPVVWQKVCDLAVRLSG